MVTTKLTPRSAAGLHPPRLSAHWRLDRRLLQCRSANARPLLCFPIRTSGTRSSLPRPKPRSISLVTRGNGLSSAQTAELRAYLRAYEKEGERLMVRAPSGGSNDAASMRAFDDVRKALRQAGITEDSVLLETYYVNGERSAPLRLSFLHYEAKAPDCPDWSENVGRDPQNTPWPNMGCATQRNLAVAVADPRDLMGPRAETPRSSERRDTSLGQIRERRHGHRSSMGSRRKSLCRSTPLSSDVGQIRRSSDERRGIFAGLGTRGGRPSA